MTNPQPVEPGPCPNCNTLRVDGGCACGKLKPVEPSKCEPPLKCTDKCKTEGHKKYFNPETLIPNSGEIAEGKIHEALARAYCYSRNSKKILDADLMTAAGEEVFRWFLSQQDNWNYEKSVLQSELNGWRDQGLAHEKAYLEEAEKVSMLEARVAELEAHCQAALDEAFNKVLAYKTKEEKEFYRAEAAEAELQNCRERVAELEALNLKRDT